MREALVKCALVLSLVSCAGQSSPPPSGACGAPTPAVTEGPYFKSGSPERTSLREAGVVGTPLDLDGRVFESCRPAPGATLDFWQADGDGRYDNSGYRLRGHQATGADGEYHLQTVVPGLYTGRTEHIHVKVAIPGKPVLTTQLFFPGVAQNESDSIYRPELLVKLSDGGSGKIGTFDFVVG